MSTNSQSNPFQRRRFWQDHIKVFATSGLSRRAYCLRHNLSYHAMTYWVRKQVQPASGPTPITMVEVPVRLPAFSIPSSTPLRLHIGSGYMIELGPDFDQATLVRTLAVLEQAR